jgi:hypothetical protein
MEIGHFYFKGMVENLSDSLDKTLENIERVGLVLKDMQASCTIDLTEEDMWPLLDVLADPEWPNVIS